ncbi:glutamine amidotransferase [Sphingomonas sp. KC8]|uniref:glutamine amidotransferase n=1 Tax=Sphingomonas sp. KC8 TaxID=1030157 RepID=UPI0002488EDF|nr:glutamine amidotransferase [Sphingomonas sp. KC8]ARS25873.1 glutamine amidotransferase [Sphingomonas sp. KC8]
MKHALIIRHVPVEGVAGFRAPIEDAGFNVDRIDVTDPAFPSVDFLAPDLVVMMGGPMGVYESEAHPWIACQIARLSERMAADRPTLGVCLGAQMMAAGLGARVYPGGRQEVGFAPVALNPVGAGSPLRHLEDVPVLHWHGDTFDLPDGTELLASTGIYAQQAFRRGPNLLALQFHAEMGEDPRFDSWLDKWPDAIAAAGQSAAQMRADHDEHGPVAVAAGRRMIVDWLAGLRT